MPYRFGLLFHFRVDAPEPLSESSSRHVPNVPVPVENEELAGAGLPPQHHELPGAADLNGRSLFTLGTLTLLFLLPGLAAKDNMNNVLAPGIFGKATPRARQIFALLDYPVGIRLY